MKAAHHWRWLSVGGVVLAVGVLSAQGVESNFGQPLTHVSFDRLVPIVYPTIRPNFARLRPTTEPLVHPGVPQVHITQGLTDSFARPLLITSERPELVTTISTTYRVRISHTERNPVQARPVIPVITRPSRPELTRPAKAKTSHKPLDRQPH